MKLETVTATQTMITHQADHEMLKHQVHELCNEIRDKKQQIKEQASRYKELERAKTPSTGYTGTNQYETRVHKGERTIKGACFHCNQRGHRECRKATNQKKRLIEQTT